MNIITTSDLYDVVLEGINKEVNGSLSTTEFETLANECQMTYIKNRYYDFEVTQKRIDDLRSLKRAELFTMSGRTLDFETTLSTTGDTIVTYSPAVDGRFGYLFMLNAAVVWSYKDNDCHPDGVAWDGVSNDTLHQYLNYMKPMKADKLYEIRTDYYNMPTDERPYYDLSASGSSRNVLTVINDTASTPVFVRLEYLVHPRTILLANTGNDDIDLPIHARQEVVNLMVRTYVERMESQRVQTVFQAQATNVE